MVRHIKTLIFNTDLSAKLPLKKKYKVRKNRTSLNELQVPSPAPKVKIRTLYQSVKGSDFYYILTIHILMLSLKPIILKAQEIKLIVLSLKHYLCQAIHYQIHSKTDGT